MDPRLPTLSSRGGQCFMDWSQIPIIFIPTLLGGVFQTLTGFGSGILLMMVLPLFVPLLQASAISTVTGLCLTFSLGMSLRRYADYRGMVFPLMVFLCCSAAAIHFGPSVNTRLLSTLFGLFLLALAVWFHFEDRDHGNRKFGKPATMALAALSGVTSGWFGLSGPPMAVYFMAELGNDKMRYIATTQVFFFIIGAFNTGVRVYEGILTLHMLSLAVWGIVGMWLGKNLGLKLLSRIDARKMRSLIHAGLAVTGLLTVLKNFIF